MIVQIEPMGVTILTNNPCGGGYAPEAVGENQGIVFAREEDIVSARAP